MYFLSAYDQRVDVPFQEDRPLRFSVDYRRWDLHDVAMAIR
jgi:hypothetical protein